MIWKCYEAEPLKNNWWIFFIQKLFPIDEKLFPQKLSVGAKFGRFIEYVLTYTEQWNTPRSNQLWRTKNQQCYVQGNKKIRTMVRDTIAKFVIASFFSFGIESNKNSLKWKT